MKVFEQCMGINPFAIDANPLLGQFVEAFHELSQPKNLLAFIFVM